MSDQLEIDPPDDDIEVLAAEYVLGLLTVAQLPLVVALRAGSTRFDEAVQRWELQLLPLAEELAPLKPSPRVWAAIAKAIAPAKQPSGLWDSLNFWRGFSLAAGAVCAALIVAVFLHRPAPPPTALATLTSKPGGVFVATLEPAAGGLRLVVAPSQVVIPAGKSAELWLIAPGSKPAPLGLLASDRPVAMNFPASGLPADLSVEKLAVSIEPLGGSPTGQPTGPVIAVAGFLTL